MNINIKYLCGIGKLVGAAMVAAVMLAGPAAAQTDITASFTDDNFRAAVYEVIGKTAPEPILDTDVASITELSVSYKSIESLAGIEHFVGLTELYCSDNQLTSLDVSALTNLVMLYCSNNQLTSLDVSALTNLETLFCSGNRLTTLDVSALTNLTSLNCHNNQLMSLDASGFTKLKTLECENNRLTVLNVSGSTELIMLLCNDNQLTSLDLSGLTNLTIMRCHQNNMPDESAVIGFTGAWSTGLDDRFKFHPQRAVSAALSPDRVIPSSKPSANRPQLSVRGRVLNISANGTNGTYGTQGTLKVRMIDMSGKTVLSRSVGGNGGAVSLAKVPAGRYLAEVRDAAGKRVGMGSVVLGIK